MAKQSAEGLYQSSEERSRHRWMLLVRGLLELGAWITVGCSLATEALAAYYGHPPSMDGWRLEGGLERWPELVLSLLAAGLWIEGRRPHWLVLATATVIGALLGEDYHPYAGLYWLEGLRGTGHGAVAEPAQGLLVGWSLLGLGWVGWSLGRELRKIRDLGAHGSGRFATLEELEALRQREKSQSEPNAFPLGEHAHHPGESLAWPRREHVAIFGGTGRGKTSTLLVPHLLAAEQTAMLIVDPKDAELYRLTSAERARRGPVWCLELGSERSNAINPVERIRRGRKEVGDATRLAHYLLPEGQGDVQGVPWNPEARTLYRAALLHAVYGGCEPTLPGIANFLTERGIREVLEVMAFTRHDPKLLEGWSDAAGEPTPHHPVVRRAALSLLGQAEETLTSIFLNVKPALSMFADQEIADLVAYTDIDIERWLTEGGTIYLTARGRDAERTKNLWKAIVDALLEARYAMGEAGPKVDMVIDELGVLGRFGALRSITSTGRSFGIRVVVGTQSLRQIWHYYGGQNEDLTPGFPVQIYLGAEDQGTARAVSQRVGKRTITRASTTVGGWSRPGSVTVAELGREVITADEVMALPRELGLAFVPNQRPILMRLSPYDHDPELATRVGQVGELAFSEVEPEEWAGAVVPSFAEARAAYAALVKGEE